MARVEHEKTSAPFFRSASNNVVGPYRFHGRFPSTSAQMTPGCGGERGSAIGDGTGRSPLIFTRLVMSVDAATVRRIAHLARISVADDEVEHLKGELNAILAFVEQLSEVNVEGVEPMTSVIPMTMKKRVDEVSDGEIPDRIVSNAPVTDDHFFLVPKVVE
jgi:aspartyl-tRNA(Asn)/glutamyl-tRNA(Gln) amidotransferase subunit C